MSEENFCRKNVSNLSITAERTFPGTKVRPIFGPIGKNKQSSDFGFGLMLGFFSVLRRKFSIFVEAEKMGLMLPTIPETRVKELRNSSELFVVVVALLNFIICSIVGAV